MAHLFQGKGYRTACIGKWHLGMDWAGGMRGEKGYNMRNNSEGIDFTKPIQNTAIANGFDEYFGIAASLDMPPYVFIRNDRVTEQPTSSLKEEDKGGYRANHAIIHHSSNGQFAIRRGDWKLLLHAGSGGNGYGAGKRSSRYNGTIEQKSFKTANRQLYNMRTDPDETTNLIEKHPEVVSELAALAGKYLRKGRSTPGPRQKTVLQSWPQLDWLPKKPTNFRSEKP